MTHGVLIILVLGVDVLNNAMDNVYTRALPEKWVYVNVSVAPSTITITEYGVTTTGNFNINSNSRPSSYLAVT